MKLSMLLKSFKNQKGFNLSYTNLGRNFYQNLNNVNDEEIIIYHHLGLGDHIICNGLVNYISRDYKVHLPVKSSNLKNVKYLYSENSSVKPFSIDENDEYAEILNYSNRSNLKILKIGFNYQIKDKDNYWNKSFYNQLGLDYEVSFSHFNFPFEYEKGSELEKHLKKFYGIKDSYALVHKQSSKKKFSLKLDEESIIEVDKESDIFNNLFLYSTLIKNARSVHCINSSFIHLVERVNTNADLYYHKLWESNFILNKDWEVISYGG